MNDTASATALWVQLANAAIMEADDEPRAITALMQAAAAILQRRFGKDAAAGLMLEMVAEAASDVNGSSGIIATKH